MWHKVKNLPDCEGWEVSDELGIRYNGEDVKPSVDSQFYKYVIFISGGPIQRLHRVLLYTISGPPQHGQIAVRNKDGTWRWGRRNEVGLKPRQGRQ